MAEMVSSAVVQETVSQILSSLVHRYEEKEESNANRNLERLEMAHIRLEAAIETSDKWQITDSSMLRWRRKLKRAAQECDDTLHKCKQRILEEEQMDQEVSESSFPKRIVHATKSFIFSAFSHNRYELNGSTVRRFEWFADGASEFLRLIELGGTPRCHMPFESFSKHLFAGKALKHRIVRENKYPLFLLWVVPFRTAEHGIEASLVLIRKDGNAPQDNFFVTVILQLSESTDIVGTVIKCLQIFTPHFKSTVEIIKKELTQLHMQDFSWVPYVDSSQKRHWDDLHSFSTQWFRPNPLCCKQHDQQHELCMSGLPEVSLESVIEVNLQCQISLPEYSKHPHQDSPHLKAELIFMPHGSSGGLLPADESSVIAMMDGKVEIFHADITTLEQLEEIVLSNAVDYFCLNAKATVYQMLWKSKHGRVYILVEKANIFMPSTRRTSRGARARKLLPRQDQELSPNHVISHSLGLWAAQAPIHLQGSIMDWIRKEKERQRAPLQLKL